MPWNDGSKIPVRHLESNNSFTTLGLVVHENTGMLGLYLAMYLGDIVSSLKTKINSAFKSTAAETTALALTSATVLENGNSFSEFDANL